MGVELVAELAALALSLIALGLSLLHVVRCPNHAAIDDAVEACETAQRKCARLVAEAGETAEQIGRRNSRMAAERSKLERAHEKRVGGAEAPAGELPGTTLTAADQQQLQRLLLGQDLNGSVI
jgi:hypothetical protein